MNNWCDHCSESEQEVKKTEKCYLIGTEFKSSLKAFLHCMGSKAAGRRNNSQNTGSTDQDVLNYSSKNGHCLLTLFTQLLTH